MFLFKGKINFKYFLNKSYRDQGINPKAMFGRGKKQRKEKYQMENLREKKNMVVWQKGESGRERKMEGKK